MSGFVCTLSTPFMVLNDMTLTALQTHYLTAVNAGMLASPIMSNLKAKTRPLAPTAMSRPDSTHAEAEYRCIWEICSAEHLRPMDFRSALSLGVRGKSHALKWPQRVASRRMLHQARIDAKVGLVEVVQGIRTRRLEYRPRKGEVFQLDGEQPTLGDQGGYNGCR